MKNLFARTLGLLEVNQALETYKKKSKNLLNAFRALDTTKHHVQELNDDMIIGFSSAVEAVSRSPIINHHNPLLSDREKIGTAMSAIFVVEKVTKVVESAQRKNPNDKDLSTLLTVATDFRNWLSVLNKKSITSLEAAVQCSEETLPSSIFQSFIHPRTNRDHMLRLQLGVIENASKGGQILTFPKPQIKR